jgi:DNA-binding LytR/AlgR family response regulator
VNPDIVLMEYPLKGKTGAGIIGLIQSKLPLTTIAFVSRTKDYAAEAIHFEVYDYLLRPIKKTEINKLLEKAHIKKRTSPLARINEIIEKKQPDSILRFNTIKGFIITTPDEILYCKADGSFTELHFTNKNMELTFLYLSQIDEILNPYNFIRISRSIIVNKNYIRKVNLKSNTLILSSNGEECEIIGSRVTLREFGKYI